MANDKMSLGDGVSLGLQCGHPGLKPEDTHCQNCGAEIERLEKDDEGKQDTVSETKQ